MMSGLTHNTSELSLIEVGKTFHLNNIYGQLYHRHANTTALYSSPVVSALGSESDNPVSSPGWGKDQDIW